MPSSVCVKVQPMVRPLVLTSAHLCTAVGPHECEKGDSAHAQGSWASLCADGTTRLVLVYGITSVPSVSPKREGTHNNAATCFGEAG